MADTISPYALLALPEFKLGLQGGYASGTSKDDALTYVLNDISETIEQYLDRQIVTRGPITSYFSLQDLVIQLFFREWPLIDVTSVWETTSRTYDSTTLLDPATDYALTGVATAGNLDADGAGIIRTPDANSQPMTWQRGWRSVKAIYSAGYPDTAHVPLGLKVVARKLAAITWREWDRGHPEMDQAAGPMGGRFSAAFLTSDMRRDLDNYARKGHLLYEERVA